MSHQPSDADLQTTTATSVHERQWSVIEADPEFQELVRRKRRFIIPATLFFIFYYFALPVLVGFFPQMMELQVIGQINLAYLFALSQFFMAWGLMAAYVARANEFDRMAAKIVDRVRSEEKK